MGITSCTISNVSYPVRGSDDQGFQFDDVLEVPGALKVIVQDASGTANFTRGEPIELVDSIDGVIYRGSVLASKPLKASPDINNPYTEHTVTCTDKTGRVAEIANTQNYENWYAGNIAVDMVVNGALGGEGITVAAGLHRDSTDSDFNTGINNNVQGTLTVGDGCLELAKAGSDVIYTERTTADFSGGTPSNVVAANNTLSPTTENALVVSVQLPVASADAIIRLQFWSGTMTVGTSDTLNYSVWLPKSNPQYMCNVTLQISDGSYVTTNTTPAPVDQNGLLASSSQDLSNYAVGQWYTRSIALGSANNGKTVTGAYITFVDTSQGTYTAYIKNVYLSSQTGNKFFAPTATQTNVNPPQIVLYVGYIPLLTTSKVVPSFDPAASSRISTTTSIDPVKLLGSSLVFWNADPTFMLEASYDGGNSWFACTNNAALPGLPSGSNVAGLSLKLQESWSAPDDPTVIPVLDSVNITLKSAPNATKSDIVQSYITQANWNAGTLSGTTATSGGDLTIPSVSRNWNDGVFSNQTKYNIFAGSSSQGVSNGKFFFTVGSGVRAGSIFNFAGTFADFTIDMDITAGSDSRTAVYLTFRSTSGSSNDGYYFLISTDGTVHMFNPAGSDVGNASFSWSTGQTYHIKMVAQGATQSIYLNNATSPTLSFSDNNRTSAGYCGIQIFNNFVSDTVYFDNFVVTKATSGTWQSSAVPVSSLGTSGGSTINWTEANTGESSGNLVFVQTSVDGGSSYQICTNNGPIPNLPAGTNLSGKTIITKITEISTQPFAQPIVRGLVWRVLGQYPGSSGTRSTKPLGIDYVDRANQSGFGTASDGQTWTPTGTGTPAVASNKLTITNTTGDFFEQLGSRTDDDMDVTVPFMLSSSSITGGMTLRYVDSNNYYKLQASTTSIDIVKKVAGVSYTLVSVASTLVTNTLYYMRFRVVNQMPVDLYGRIWQAGTLEDQENWTISTSD